LGLNTENLINKYSVPGNIHICWWSYPNAAPTAGVDVSFEILIDISTTFLP